MQLDGAYSDSQPSISLRVSLLEHLVRDGDIARDSVAAAHGDLSKMHMGKPSAAILEQGSQAVSFGQTAAETIESPSDVLVSIEKVMKGVDAFAKVVNAVSEVSAKFDSASIDSGVG